MSNQENPGPPRLPFIADHGLYVLQCPPGAEAGFFSESGFRCRYGREGDQPQPTENVGASRESAAPTTDAGWHFRSDRESIFTAAENLRICVAVEGGIGKTKALEQAQHLWNKARVGHLTVFLEADDLPTDVNYFLDRPPPGKSAAVLVDAIREAARQADNVALRSGSVTLESDLARLLYRTMHREHLLLVVDSFDQMSPGGDLARKRVAELAKLLRRHPRLRCIISGRPAQIQDYGGLKSGLSGNTLLTNPQGTRWVYCQVPTFTPQQRDHFLDHGQPPGLRRSDHLQVVEADLLTVPRFLERLRTIPIERLRSLRTASDVYWESLLHLIQVGIDKHSQEGGKKWELEELVRSWSVLAYEMVRQGKELELEPEARHLFLDELCTARRDWLKKVGLPTDTAGWKAHLGNLSRLNMLMNHAVQEGREDGTLRWHDKTLRDFFAGVWLTRHAGRRAATADAALEEDHAWFTSGPRLLIGRERASDDFYPIWRFATGMPVVGGVFPSQDRHVICAPQPYISLMQHLLQAGRRSTEMIYRGWGTLMALAGRLPNSDTRRWSEAELTAANTAAQHAVWREYLPAPAGGGTGAPAAPPQAAPNQVAAWQVVWEFLAEYPRLVARGPTDPVGRIAHAFEQWFVPIPPHPTDSLEFQMSSERRFGDNRGVTHHSHIESRFQLAQYPVTNAVYGLFDPQHWRHQTNYLRYTLGHTPDTAAALTTRNTSRWREWWLNLVDWWHGSSKVAPTENAAASAPEPHPDCPVQWVDWFDAWSACLFLHSHLPTEHAWEYACRAQPNAATAEEFWFGNESRATAQHRWCATTRGGQFRCDLVGGPAYARRLPNRWGLFDMHANVWEWTASWYFDDPEHGRHPAALGRSRVLRGGSFSIIPDSCRSAFRCNWHPALIDFVTGFRAARACFP